MPLIILQDIHLSYGQPPLLDKINLSIEAGEKVCLIGRNGAGKSTLLKVIAGQVQADDGDRKVAAGVHIAQLEQQVPQNVSGSVFDVIADGLGHSGALLQRYHRLTLQVAEHSSEQLLAELQRCQTELENSNGWDINQRVESIISKMELNADADIADLSGGYKRRVLLARALVAEPQLLLLDEPTNHLDVESILWLEQFLKNWPGALLFISHDRQFMDNLASRYVEIDRGQLQEFNCDYATYLQRKEEMLDAEDKQNALFDKRLSQEETWIRQGIKARRTRNEGRVRALKKMRDDYAARRVQTGSAQMSIQQAEKSGKVVCEAKNISYSFPERPLVKDFSTLIQRGDKIGLIGKNGVGKTTLLKLLLGELEPQSGSIKVGTNLNIAYFDQYRAALDEEKSVQDNVSGGRDMLEIDGKSRHVISYLQDFLFPPQRCRQPVKALSGGERNRLLLAKLFTRPSNLLVLDEPTNDLDIDTLELLEELLINYQGTLLLVSHDRAFLNNVVTSTLVFENGTVNQYVGGYDDWLRQRPSERKSEPPVAGKPPQSRPEKVQKTKKLSYKDQRELDQLPARIDALEETIAALGERVSAPDFYKQSREDIAVVEQQLADAQSALEDAFLRWEELESQ